MSISKEERLALEDLIHDVSKGDPNFPHWEYDRSNPFEDSEVIAHSPVDGSCKIGSFESKWHTELAVAAVNAAPKLLSSLRSLEKRVAELEASQSLRPMDTAPHDGNPIIGISKSGCVYKITHYVVLWEGPSWTDSDFVDHDASEFIGWMPFPKLTGKTK